jgi:hypothetical protein
MEGFEGDEEMPSANVGQKTETEKNPLVLTTCETFELNIAI